MEPGPTAPSATSDSSADVADVEGKGDLRWDAFSTVAALGLLIAAAILFALLVPRFRSLSIALSIGVSWWFVALLVLGLTLVMTTGRMDLSGAAVALVAAAVAVKLANAGAPLLLAFLPAALVAAAVGAASGLVASISRSASYLGTFATAAFCQSLAVHLTGAPQFALLHGAQALTPLIVPAVLLAVAAVAVAVIALMSPAGVRLRRLGRDGDVPLRTLVPTLVATYAVAAVLAAGAGVGEVSRTGVASSLGVAQTEVTVVAAAILGGATLRGGRGAGFGAVLSALTLTVLMFGLGALRIPLLVSTAAIGVVLAAMLVWDELRWRLLERFGVANAAK